ncbi:MAG: transglutaminase-like domain-containing protein [Bacillota bacterium]
MVSEENLNNNPEISEDLDRILEKIQSPDELLEFMEESLEYGYVGKESHKIISIKDPDFDKDFDKEYFLQTPEQLIVSRHGVCWDQVELERRWFSKMNYIFKVYFLMFGEQEVDSLPTHTFLVYKNASKFYWFENSFAAQRGIHGYRDLESLFEDVKGKQLEYAKRECGAIGCDSKEIIILEYETPKFGSDTNEFINNILYKRFS